MDPEPVRTKPRGVSLMGFRNLAWVWDFAPVVQPPCTPKFLAGCIVVDANKIFSIPDGGGFYWDSRTRRKSLQKVSASCHRGGQSRGKMGKRDFPPVADIGGKRGMSRGQIGGKGGEMGERFGRSMCRKPGVC